MRPSSARSSGAAASCHMLSSVGFITTTCESEFLVHTAGRRPTTTADQGQGPTTSAPRRGLAHRRTQDVGREEILSCQPASEDRPAHLSNHHQGALGLRTGSPADERRTWSVDPPSASAGDSSQVGQLVQAMAGFGGGTGAAESLNTAPSVPTRHSSRC